MKKKKGNVKGLTIISIIIVLLVLFLTIGWSSFSTGLHLDSMAMVRITNEIRVTDFIHTTSTNGGISQSAEYNVSSISDNISLPNSNSTITYKVEITNMQLAANTYMGISSLDGLPSNLDVLNIVDYTLKDKICDDTNTSDCGSGAQKTFYITIGYKDNNSFDANNTEYSFNIDVLFKKVFDINYVGITNPPSSPTTFMDGDSPTITFNSDTQSSLTVTSGGVTLVSGTNYTYSNHVMTFITPLTDHLFIASPSVYMINYVLNGGTQANNQIISYTVGEIENILPPQTREDAVFDGWYLYNDFSGSAITDTSTLDGNVTLYAKWNYKVAKIGNVYYLTLRQAINAAPNNVNTTIDLIHDATESVTVGNTKILTLDFHNNTLQNNGANPVITNNGNITFVGGTIASNTTQGAVNNNSIFNMTGGMINATGTRQAIYNMGTVNISGNAYLKNVSIERAVVQNLTGGTVIITGGTIEATNYSAVVNDGTLRIGTKDGNVSTTVPLLRGRTYGVEATTNFDFYDGKLQGGNLAINDDTLLNDIETDYVLVRKLESVSGSTYQSGYLAHSPYRVTFNPTGGTVNENERLIEPGGSIGVLPSAIKTGYILVGWFDDDHDGHMVDPTEVINSNITFYAHWDEPSPTSVARIGNTEYTTLQDAWDDAMAANSKQTIEILQDISLTEKLTVLSGKSVVVDLASYTIDTTAGTIFEVLGTFELRDSGSTGTLIGGKVASGQIPVIVNKSGGITTISGGNITSNVSQVIDNSGTMNITGGNISIGNVVQGVINNNARATLVVSGGTISATIPGSKRQAIYNKGTLTISGNAVLTSASKDRATVQNDASGASMTINGGTIISTNASCERGAVQNVSGAKVIITGGTITSNSTNTNSGAVQNAGTLIIGVKGGDINSTSPDLQAETYGVNNLGSFKFYDGVLKGKLNSINGTVDEIEPGSTQIDTTEIIGGVTYYKTYLN